ncbi:serine/threonine-protein kinase/endoribonuclease IRE1a isoform X2 [Diospyros lotus]|uniref:serine/threonine-protein kinase/endoribonuclease IRE1a isoform X2 n=1 Tax=Diospyros lotus TaxID=55363 RepID=UPI002253467E|nr:serine/threonine-protein kinase/endoribonuclease IRE1a isoform X2 [Diospyros lotus]XP_052196649.1 serine/threonine-protein kinase/endoribonuclease IRE1a isoform X2 [Diospyros lotus]
MWILVFATSWYYYIYSCLSLIIIYHRLLNYCIFMLSQKLKETVEEFVSNTPLIAEDGGVVLGSKKTTVFLVDAKSGRLIYSYSLSDSSSTSQSNDEKSVLNSTSDKLGNSGPLNLKPDELPIYITRTDYALKSFVLNSDKVLWNMTVAEIGAAFLCQDSEDSFNGALSNSGYESPVEPGVRFSMPLPCQSKAVVYRFRRHNMLGPSDKPNVLPESDHQDMMVPLSDSNYMLRWQPEFDIFTEPQHKDGIPSLSAPDLFLSSQPGANLFMDSHHTNGNDLAPSLPQKNENSMISGMKFMKIDHNNKLNVLLERPIVWPIIYIVTFLVGLFTCGSCALLARKDTELAKKLTDLNASTVPPKKKKARKSGKNSDFFEKTDKSSSLGDGYDDRPLLKLNQSLGDSTDGRRIGKLFVSNREIAKGSNGTIVLEGIYEGRLVAVKRLVKAHHDIAFKEIQNLIASDRHPNIVRWYGVESDQDFVYLSLERCTCSLSDLIQMCSDTSEKPTYTEDQPMEAMIKNKVCLDSMKGSLQDIKLWKDNGFPSPLLLKLMRDVVSGLVHLHELGIIHRDLKPHNVLIIKERSLCAKLSDMGISKRLVGDMSSLGHHATGYGSSGWQAPEQLLHGRQTRAVDMFSLGCVLFYCITGGRHPFGDRLERDINIVNNKADLFLVEYIPEATDLFSRLLDPNAELRPKALDVLHHPLFWNSEMRLSFFRDTSDRVELEDRETGSVILKGLESIAPVALGSKWDEKMEPAFLYNIGRYRRYKFDSVRDLLRVMRNKLNHYRELPVEIQDILGPVPEGFDGYFASRFPKLLIEVYKVMYQHCREEECYSKYFQSSIA